MASELDLRVAQRTRELAETNEELQLQVGLLQHLPVSAWTLKPDGTPDLVNQVWLEYSGQTFDFVRSHPEAWMTAVHPEDRETASRAFWDGVRSGQGFAMETRSLRAQDGTYRWHLQQAVPLRDADGKVLKFVGTTTDIDDQKRAQEELRASEGKLRRVIDTIPTLSWCNLPDGPNEFLSKGWHEYTGLSPEEAHGWGWSTSFHPDDLPPLMKRWQELLVSGEPGEIEARIRRHDGLYRWFLIRVAPFRDETGTILRWYGTSTDIHDRKLADEALRASETNLRQIVNSIPGLICTMSPAGEIEQLNQPLLEYFGKTPEELKSWRMTDAVHPDDLPEVVNAYTYSIATGTPYEIEHRCRRADGVYRWFQVRALAVRDADGHITGWYVLLTDIDDRKRVEEELRASENDLRKILDSIPGLVCAINPAGQIELANQPLMDYYGMAVEELNKWGTNGIVHPEDLPQVVEEFTHSMTTGTPYESELRYRRADGVYRWFQVRILPVRDKEGRITVWYALITDIEDRKRAEDAVRARERDLSSIINTIPAMAWSTQADGFCDFTNRHWLDFTGLSAEQGRGWGWGAAIHPDDLNELVEYWQAQLASGTPVDTEARMRRFDGEYRWFLFRANPLRDESGNIVRWYGTNTDIDDRKRAEDELRHNEALLAQVQSVSLTGGFSWCVETDVLTFSEEAYRIFEFEKDAPVTLGQIASRVHPEDIPLLSQKMAGARSGGDHDYEIRLRMPDGTVKYLHTISHGVRDHEGRLEYIGAVQDITRRRVSEEALGKARSELAQVSRATTLGVLTASIAHEVNQPLSGIITNASTCLRMLAADPPQVEGAKETARRTIRDGNRASDVIARLRALFSKKDAATESVNLNEAALEVIALSSTELQKNRVVLRSELADDLPLVTGDRVQLQQVILNLLRNGSDAMSAVEDRPRAVGDQNRARRG
ncbi:MAG: PAS domain-containing protein [Terracidiphilus sp.]